MKEWLKYYGYNDIKISPYWIPAPGNYIKVRFILEDYFIGPVRSEEKLLTELASKFAQIATIGYITPCYFFFNNLIVLSTGERTYDAMLVFRYNKPFVVGNTIQNIWMACFEHWLSQIDCHGTNVWEYYKIDWQAPAEIPKIPEELEAPTLPSPGGQVMTPELFKEKWYKSPLWHEWKGIMDAYKNIPAEVWGKILNAVDLLQKGYLTTYDFFKKIHELAGKYSGEAVNAINSWAEKNLANLKRGFTECGLSFTQGFTEWLERFGKKIEMYLLIGIGAGVFLIILYFAWPLMRR